LPDKLIFPGYSALAQCRQSHQNDPTNKTVSSGAVLQQILLDIQQGWVRYAASL
jgi:hypothetical protein